MPAAPAELLEFLAPYETSVRELALKLRRLVLAELGACHENIYDAYNAVAISYGTSPKLSDGICHIAVYAGHVNLGFHKGAQLDDPSGVLRGSGKSIRHVRIETAADLRRPELRPLLRQAQAIAGVTKVQRGEVSSRVKAVYPKKRRPLR